MVWKMIPTIILILSSFISISFCIDRIVLTEYGPVKGYIHDSDIGSKYISFRGVPYSKQPVKDLRFELLQEPEPWRQPYEAKTEVPNCPQLQNFFGDNLPKKPMSEECLGANIHVPAKKADKPLPVFVFVHGGGFNYLSGDSDFYGPEYLVAQDVIVVTFNYRLGILGFLSLGTEDAPGNLGLKDVVFFLKWVQRNIAAFGGDPKEVTLGGMSAGASIVHLMTLSPMGKGLFKRVIMHSGSALGSFLSFHPSYNNQLNENMFNLLGINDTDPHDRFEKLKSLDIETISNASDILLNTYGFVTYVPVVENKFKGIEAFIDKSPYELMASKKYIDVPQMIGFTIDESISFEQRALQLNYEDILKLNTSAFVPLDIALQSPPEKFPKLHNLFVNTYLNTEQNRDKLLESFLNYITDSYFIYPALRLGRFNALHSTSPTYMFRYAYNGTHNLFSRFIAEASRKSVGHADDLSYLFKANYYHKDIKPNTADDMTKRRIVQMWSNFIKYGNPTPKVTGIVPLTWPAVDVKRLTYLNIGKKLQIKRNPFPEMMSFYDQFYPL